MFEGIPDLFSLRCWNFRVRAIQEKIEQEEKLTADEEKLLKDLFLGMGGGNFRDEKHRDKLLDEWFKGAKILAKRFKAEKEIKAENE